MSSLHHEAILETIFDEVMAELESKNLNLLFSKEELEETASTIAQERFEDLSR
mgnify:CR=1 FL=1